MAFVKKLGFIIPTNSKISLLLQEDRSRVEITQSSFPNTPHSLGFRLRLKAQVQHMGMANSAEPGKYSATISFR